MSTYAKNKQFKKAHISGYNSAFLLPDYLKRIEYSIDDEPP